MNAKVKVGTMTITEEKVFTTFYECAAWEQRVRVAPGTYEVVAYVGHGGRICPSILYVQAEGEIVEAHFPPLYAGVSIGPDRGGERVGQRDRASWSIPSYWYEHPEGLQLDEGVNLRTWVTNDGRTMHSVG